MNCIIPFTKDIKFNTNIGDILSVSLEHDYTANNNETLGNFTITGEYKTHEVSVNKEKFEYVLPFSVDLSTRIDTDSIDFAVEDFTYEVVEPDILRVNIEYSVNALELKEEEPIDTLDEVPSLDSLIDEIDRSEFEQKISEEINQEEPEEETKEDDEEIKTEEEMIVEAARENEIPEETKSTIIDSISDKENDYVTYQIHIMQETDTIEAICTKYNTSTTILGEYNDISSLSIGDKVIIPQIDE